MSSTPNSPPTPAVSEERTSLLGRMIALPTRGISAARNHPLLAVVLVCGLAIIAMSLLSVGYYVTLHSRIVNPNVTIAIALNELDAGNYAEAKNAAAELRAIPELDYRKQGYAIYVQGVVLAHEADQMNSEAERRTLYLVAARYLEEARDRGFPAGREDVGLYLLANCLFKSGHYAESLPALQAALEALPRRKYELYQCLATAYLRDNHADFQRALHYNRLSLKDPSLTAGQRDELTILQTEILLGLDDATTCRQMLDAISDDSPVHDQALVMLGRLLIHEGNVIAAQSDSDGDEKAIEAKEKFRQAIAALERAQTQDLAGITTRQARYLLGICYQNLGDSRAAIQAFARTRNMHYRTDEALAAELSEAEIHQSQGRHDAALSSYLKVIEESEDPAAYRNPWITLPQMRKRLYAAHKRFRDGEDFASAIKLCDAFAMILPPDETAEAVALTHNAWAESLMRQAELQEHTLSHVTEAEARQHFRLAGEAYRQLARLRFATPKYPDDLWKSGESFLRGQNYETAIQVLGQYLDNAPRKQHPQGLVGLGESHLALGHFNKALQILNDCIKYYPKHPESYRARLVASLAYEQLQKNDKAKALLVDNLHNTALTPRSIYWQRSLFNYGALLFKEALRTSRWPANKAWKVRIQSKRQAALQEMHVAHDLFLEAIQNLDEAVQRYPDVADAIEARYVIAESYLHAAKLPDRSLEVEPTQTRRNALSQQKRRYLQAAAEAHRQLQNELFKKQEQFHLSAVEASMLRNTYFAYADALFDQGEYDEAINAYSAATNRYQNEPESLEAFLQIASCFRRLNSPAEARGTLRQARAVLSRIRADADFQKTTRYNRNEWDQIISWLSQL